jgi:hypothetical protein
MGNYSYSVGYDSLAFSGGGVCGVGHAGVVKALSELNYYKNMINFSGASVGSIVAALCAVRATSHQIEQCMDFDFKSLLDDDYGCARDIYRLWYESGYYKGDVLYERIKESVVSVAGKDVTFADLKEYGTTLKIPVTKVWKTHCEVVVYSNETTPSVTLSHACRLSCTYPSVFRSLESCSDGGLFCNYPINLLPVGRRFGVKFEYETQTEEKPVTNLSEYLSSIICTMHSRIDSNVDPVNTITVPVAVSSTEFSINKEQREEIFQKGYEMTIQFFKK